jgi:hypothetical protein
MKYIIYLLPLILLISQCRKKEPDYISLFPGKPDVPSSIKQEHEHLLGQMHAFTLYQDSTGRVALKLDSLMQHHFQEEEDFVLPPLGHLPLLASGAMPAQSEAMIGLTEKLKSQLIHLSVEHQMIKAYMGELKQAAVRDNHPEITEFEKELHKHATSEEEVLFPAAILVGEYLKLKSQQSQQ